MAVDFERLLEKFKVPVRTDVNKGWVNVNCCYCDNPPDEHFNGGFNVRNPRYSCWRCGSHYWVEALSKTIGVPFGEAKRVADAHSFVTSEPEEKKRAMAERLDLPGYPLNDSEKAYLRQRGFDVDWVQSKFRLRGGGLAGEWAQRIIIPVYYKRVLVSWTGRSLLSRELIKELGVPRYKNLSIEQSVVNPKDVFFNMDNATKKSVMIVEGPFDAMKMGDDCVCSLGTSVTDAQRLLLKERYEKVFVCFDNEPSAQEKARKLGMNLASVGMEVEVVNICEPFGKNDPGELENSEAAAIKKELFGA